MSAASAYDNCTPGVGDTLKRMWLFMFAGINVKPCQ